MDDIYGDDDFEAPDASLLPSSTPVLSVNPSDSVSHAQHLHVPSIRRILGLRSWVFNHFISTRLDTYYILRRTQKRVQDQQHKCKECSWSIVDSKRYGTTNMSDHLKTKHSISQAPNSRPLQQSILDTLTRSLTNTNTIARPLMSLEEAVLAWIIDTLQPFTVVEKPSFQRIFECLG